jgi:hypothetical protein
MGTTLQAYCSCGYESDILSVGGGMMDMGQVCYAPALSRRRKEVVARDYLKDPQPKSWARDIIWYKDSKLRGDKKYSDEPVVYWSDLFDMPDINYFCPACEKMTMRFKFGGIRWD